jgi:TRAP-type C4-dicarboxylate transport system permease small subunit
MKRSNEPVWTRVIDYTMALLLSFMVVLVFGNVVLRYGFNSGISASEELSRYSFVWLIFLGAAVGLYRRDHMGVNTLVRMLPRGGQVVMAIVGELLMLGCCGLLVFGGIAQAIINHDNLSPGTKLPVSLLYAPGALAAAIMCLVLLHSLFRILRGHLADEDLHLASDEAEAALRAIEPGGAR